MVVGFGVVECEVVVVVVVKFCIEFGEYVCFVV